MGIIVQSNRCCRVRSRVRAPHEVVDHRRDALNVLDEVGLELRRHGELVVEGGGCDEILAPDVVDQLVIRIEAAPGPRQRVAARCRGVRGTPCSASPSSRQPDCRQENRVLFHASGCGCQEAADEAFTGLDVHIEHRRFDACCTRGTGARRSRSCTASCRSRNACRGVGGTTSRLACGCRRDSAC